MGWISVNESLPKDSEIKEVYISQVYVSLARFHEGRWVSIDFKREEPHVTSWRNASNVSMSYAGRVL